MFARRFVLLVLVSLCALAGGLACGVGSAGAVVSQFGSRGQGAGQFNNGQGIAVNQASGNVYLLDKGNDRVDEFTSEGVFVMAWGEGVADGVTPAPQTCTTTCFQGIASRLENERNISESEPGELGLGPVGVAVDNDPLSVSYQDVYVPEYGNERVEKFSSSGSFISMFGKEVNENGTDVCVAGEKCRAGKAGSGDGEFNTMEGAVAVGPTGDVFVGDRERVQEFSPEGVFIASFSLEGGYTSSLAVDGAGDLYVVSKEGELSSLREYDSSGVLLRTLDAEGQPKAVTLDGSGDVFVEDALNNVHRMLEYGPGGEQLASYDTGMRNNRGDGIAFSESLDMLYLIENLSGEGRSDVRLLAPPVPGPELVDHGSVSGIEPLSVTLNATVNPEGVATTYRFEYGLTSSYGSSAPTPEGSLSASFNEEPVSVVLTKLTAGTTYHYRVVASDAKGHVATGPDEVFTTQQPVLIDSVSATNVAATSATFEALLNPLGVEASYRLEYDTSEYVPGGPSHGTVAIEGSLGSGSSDVPVSVHVDGLLPGTVYHYRVVARDTREGVAYTVASSDETLTTQNVGGGLGLPDGRRWEMVSPADKKGAQILAIGQYSGEGAVIESAADGGALTYMTAAPTEAEPQGYDNYEQVLSSRGSGGWGSSDISIPHEAATRPSTGYGEEYRFFSEDLSLGVVQPFGQFDPVLSGEASEETSFLRTDFLNGDPNSPCLSGCFRPLVTSMQGYANVPAGTVFASEGNCPIIVCGPEFFGASSDAKHVILRSKTALTSTSLKGITGEGSLYEWSDGTLALINVLPEGEVASEPILGNGDGANARHAISEDGSRVVWSSGGHLYMRDVTAVPEGMTVQLDAAQGGSGEGPARAGFQIASSDGSRVFFTSEQKLTVESSGAADLYECEMVEEADELKCRLSDLTPSGSAVSGEMQGVVGASNDGSWVYFASGTTLYVHHGGATKRVAELASADKPDWSVEDLPHMTSRVSSDGRWLVFMSQRELAGYDTHDAVTGEPDEEVYLYDAMANGGVGRVVCASCDPTGARPVGVLDPGDGLALGDRVWSGVSRVAANVPGWTPYSLSVALYQSRYLSDSGRLFFNSNDALVPQDVNGTEDVYEYELPGVGNCTSESVSFSVRSGGCVRLVSSGSSGEESGFMDASATGGEVFFLTAARLSSADRDTAVDIYDAHECSTGSPCLAVPSAVPPVCDTGDSCKAAPTPQPSIFGAPSSATFSGAGNVTQADGKPAVRVKGLTRAQKLTRALRECRKRKGRRRRAVCVRRARARYARSGSLRVNASGKGGR
jgi:WD40-like Beta Propeller Repeat